MLQPQLSFVNFVVTDIKEDYFNNTIVVTLKNQMYLVQKKNLYTIESVTALFNSKTDAKYWFRKIENTVIIQETTINLLTPKI